MKQNKVKLYAQALALAIMNKKVDEKKIISNFLSILQKNNVKTKTKEIVNLAQTIILKKQGKRKIILETARKLSLKQKEAMNIFIKNGDILEEKINPDLIAGIKIVVNNEKQLDVSMLKKIQNLF